jgi:GAF domain-containing protein
MVVTNREAHLGTAFVRLADSLVGGLDVVDILNILVEECKTVLDVDEAGLVLAGAGHELQMMVATSDTSAFLEQAQIKAGEGPCIEAFTSGQVVTIDDIERSFRWADFRTTALAAGFRAVHAVPLRLRDDIIGALNLFSITPGALTGQDATVAQALADVATIAIIQYRAASEQSVVTTQLQNALDSRVVIEQAKGVIAQYSQVSMDEAFARMRTRARSSNSSLRSVAETVIARELQL